MRHGKMSAEKTFKSGDVILTQIQFTDSGEIKTRPAVILFEEFDNFVIAGITSNPSMKGIPLTEEEGAIKPSVIKLNYLFTISDLLIKRKLFSLSRAKSQLVYKELVKKLQVLID